MLVPEKEVFWYLEQNLSPEQHQKLAQMRQELEQAGDLLPAATLLADDMTLLRFLNARAWCVHKAVKMYQVGTRTSSRCAYFCRVALSTAAALLMWVARCAPLTLFCLRVGSRATTPCVCPASPAGHGSVA